MLNICILSVVMIFCVLGIYFLIKEITSFILKNDIKSQVILEIHDNSNEAENALRSILSANPNSDITVIDKSNNSEINTILHKLSEDNSRVHIK
ncbi:MAG: hypothetical protein ACI4A5_10515 [Hominilimicola sp.]